MAIIGDVLCFVQANNGDVFCGTNDAARIYKSSDNGQTWTLVTTLGGTAAVTGMVKDNNGRLFASVQLGAATQGIWRSTNNGATWTRVKTNPASANGYLDITLIKTSNRVMASGYGASGVQGNITWSGDGGTTWSNGTVGVSTAAQQLHRIAASEVGSEAWFGAANVTPMPILSNSGGVGSTARNTIPVAGKDIAVFGFVSPTGVMQERRLWAAQNGVNTEIWRFASDLLSGNVTFAAGTWAKVYTIAGAIFNCLYVDPTPSQNTQNRTIWAGADGKIFVSYNNGSAWAVATEAPTGNMYAFIRTAAGVLIAGGQNGEIFLFSSGSSGGSGSEGGGGNEEEPPPVTPPTTPETPPSTPAPSLNAQLLGREATCEDEVYASNKFSFSNISHVLYYNGSVYEELQFATELPYTLFGDPPTVGRIIYFGSKTTDSNVPAGTFSSVVFDITKVAENITVVWEYWNGSTWTALTVQDNTSNFHILGANSVHWQIPSSWTTVSVNSLTGYWVRARISAVGSSPVAPVHDNRYIYTVNLPYIEIAESEIKGDLPAAMKVRWNNRADDLNTNLSLQLDRFVCGLRSVSRGNNFNAYINISDTHPLFGVSLTKDADGTWGSTPRAPTTRALTVSHASGGRLNTWNDLVTFTFANTVAKDYYGQFRAFVRCYKIGSGTNNWQLRLKTVFGSGGGSVVSKAVFPTLAAEFEVLDFGQISIPTIQLAQQAGNLGDQLSLIIQGYNTSTGIALRLFDLILIPYDEWAVDARAPELSTSATTDIKGSYYMDIDSITNPKTAIMALNRNGADQIVSRYQAINNGPAILQKHSTQRLWFLGMSYENFWRGNPEIAGSVQVYKQQRYLGFRGRN